MRQSAGRENLFRQGGQNKPSLINTNRRQTSLSPGYFPHFIPLQMPALHRRALPTSLIHHFYTNKSLRSLHQYSSDGIAAAMAWRDES
jgi:hypothetical protein